MGMDVYGRKPSKKEGEYFRATVWSWRPILILMNEAGFEVPAEWGHNMGDGFVTQESCDILADLLERHLRDERPGVTVFRYDLGGGMAVDENGVFTDPGPNTRSPYAVERTHVVEWLEFLRSCGGFQIY